MHRRLLSPDPAEGGDLKQTKSTAAVKAAKNAKTPREIELEKKISTLEDEVGTLRAAQGAPPKPKVEPKASPKTEPEKQATPKGGFFADVEREIWG